jgi:hypothetical protein
MIWANGYSGGTSSGIPMNIPHSDFIVSLGKWNENKGGTDEQKIGTFIHELGHNLGLMHGGNDHIGYKPNHVSVMNYSFQMSGIKFATEESNSGTFNYQSDSLPSLNEAMLNEEVGLNADKIFEGYLTTFRSIGGAVVQGNVYGKMDWNTNGAIESILSSIDLNGDGEINELSATPSEWNNLRFDGGNIGKPGQLQGILEDAKNSAKPLPFVELTEEENKRVIKP